MMKTGIHSSVFFLVITCIFVFACKKENSFKSPSADHVSVFNELWQVLDQRYALFEEKQVVWNDVYSQYAGRVNNSLSDDQFFRLMSDMLETLKDGHVVLQSGSKKFVYDGFYSGYIKSFSYAVLLNNYLQNQYSTAGALIYKIVDNVGYIYIGSFASPLSVSDIDKVLDAMQSVKGLIIDVRNNAGGNTAMADHLFSYFIQQKTLAKYEKIKKGKGHNDFYDPKAWYIEPNGKYFDKKIILLTNRTCFSACNDFVMYLSQLDNVKVTGDQTGGGGSVPYNYVLANGWVLQYSATVTLTPDKKPIEDGIQPDENIIMTPFQESAGYDPLIDNAFKLLH